MFTRILVPLDGSKRAERALAAASRVARASRAHVYLVRAVAIPPTFGLMYEGQTVQWNLIRDETKIARAYLDALESSRQLEGLSVESITPVGDAATVILDAVAKHGCDLVVMASHGRTGPSRWVLGSVAEHIVRHSLAPVLVLRASDREDADFLDSDTQHPLRMLVPLDGSPLAEAALAPARMLALAIAAPGPAAMHLMLVIGPYEAETANMPDALIVDGAQAYLKDVAQRLVSVSEGEQVAVSWSVTADYDFAHGILAAAKAEHVEDAAGQSPLEPSTIIAMATHGYGGLTRWALGSVAERVLHATHLPILVVHPAAQAESAATD